MGARHQKAIPMTMIISEIKTIAHFIRLSFCIIDIILQKYTFSVNLQNIFGEINKNLYICSQMSKIKVLEVIRQGQIGGGESHLLDLVTFLDKERFEPVCLSFTSGEMINRLEAMGVSCHHHQSTWHVHVNL